MGDQAATRPPFGVTSRWIESQRQICLPHLHTGGMNRYHISEIETWLHERYG